MSEWQYHDEDEERESWWGQPSQFTILSAESAGGDLPTVGDPQEFDASVQKLLGRL